MPTHTFPCRTTHESTLGPLPERRLETIPPADSPGTPGGGLPGGRVLVRATAKKVITFMCVWFPPRLNSKPKTRPEGSGITISRTVTGQNYHMFPRTDRPLRRLAVSLIWAMIIQPQTT